MEYANNTIDAQTIAAYAATKTENALPANYVDEKSQNCDAITASPIDLLYSPIVRGGRKMGSSCGCSSMSGGSGESSTGIIGGCFNCKKGIKNIIYIYSTIHIIIPRLYRKYKANRPSSLSSSLKIAKILKVAKAAKATKVARPKVAKAATAVKVAKVAKARPVRPVRPVRPQKKPQ
jgi:hypothetical protein